LNSALEFRKSTRDHQQLPSDKLKKVENEQIEHSSLLIIFVL